MTTEENIGDILVNTGVNDDNGVSQEEAAFTNIELVSDEEEESPEEEPGVVTYSCILGHNVPCVMQTLAPGAEEDTQAPPCNVKEAEGEEISEPVEDLITSNTCDDDDDFVAAPMTSKFVVNFTREDPGYEDSANIEPRTELGSEEPIRTLGDIKEENNESEEDVKEDNHQTDIKQKVSTKDKIFNVLFGCFRSRKCNKSSS